jgi:rhamnulose-1-phosphate aldolase
MDRSYLSKNVNEVIKVSSDIWRKGWAEANGGNITVRMTEGSIEEFDHELPRSEWQSIGAKYSNLANEYFVVSGSGRFLRNIEILPEKNIGVIKLDKKGEKYQIIWGFEGNTNPTSELRAHLHVHSVRKNVSDGLDRAVIHTHAPQMIALTYLHEFDSKKLSRLLWEMHTECAIVFPEGIGLLKWLMPGTNELAVASAKLFETFRIIVWDRHGVMACGRNLDGAFGLIDTAEKVATIYLRAMSAGGVKRPLSKEMILNLAKHFKANINKKFLEGK